MEFFEIKESDLKSVTLFLVAKKIIFHPTISPDGFPDFSNHHGRKHILILDRNILSHLIKLLKTGELKDEHCLKLVGSLMFWAQFNNISITSGLALSEYAQHTKSNFEVSYENDLFLKAFNFYNPKMWLELGLGERRTIDALNIEDRKQYDFYKEYDHYKMHFIEMMKIAELYFDSSLSKEMKIAQFHEWVYKNLLICKYTITYLALLIGERINTFDKVSDDLNDVLKKCRNQAWDLSYLSLWSTFYYNENSSNPVYLFATMDKGLKQIFTITHRDSQDIHKELFGQEVGGRIIGSMLSTFKKRPTPKINEHRINELIEEGLDALRSTLSRRTFLPSINQNKKD